MILVAVGANLPGPDGSTPLQSCRAAVRRVAALPGLRLAGRSRWYASPAFSPSDQPDYANGAVRLEGVVAPEFMLRSLHRIEAEAGRRRTVLNAARPLDLDLLGIDDLVIEAPGLRLPHPRLHLRRFVLLPLADVAPGWRHPTLGRTAAELLADAPPDGTRLLAAAEE